MSRRKLSGFRRPRRALPPPACARRRRTAEWRYQSLDRMPERVAGVTLVDESPGFTGIYLRSPSGGLYPARTVIRRPAAHHERVVNAWLEQYGGLVDLRRKVRRR